MRLPAKCLSLVLPALVAGTAFAQRPATAVQLPTFSFFSAGTTVSVPDRGSVYLGGVKRAATGRNEFGVPLLPFRPFRNTAIGREVSASNLHVTATIHDFEAMDEFLLSQPTGFSQSLWARPPRDVAAALGKTLQPRDPTYGAAWNPSIVADSAGRPAINVAEARARRLRQQDVRAGEAVSFFQRGRKAEAAGKAGVAKIYYQMAARRASGQLKEQVAARLEALGGADTASKIAQRQP